MARGSKAIRRECPIPGLTQERAQSMLEKVRDGEMRWEDFARIYDVAASAMRSYVTAVAKSGYSLIGRRSKTATKTRWTPPSQVEVDRAVELYERGGLTIHAVAGEMKRSDVTIRKMLEGAGVTITPGVQPKTTPDQARIVMAHRRNGHTYAEIAGITGLSASTVRRVITGSRGERE